uniref:C2H2-type domain-containing protein n=1 Tax=Mola mola TaxID=94237 RepID=A0A3Q3WB86_MOLML
MMAITGGTVETLDEIPAHVWKGLPECLSLGPSVVNPSRVGELINVFKHHMDVLNKVKNVVFMTKVGGWMCVDATDPMKGNWLRYVNWAHSTLLSLLQPIGPGEELLVWFTVEGNPEITAALEEERASSLSRKGSPRAKRGEEEDNADLEEPSQIQQQSVQCSPVADSMQNKHPGALLPCGEESHKASESSSLARQEPEVDPELDPDPTVDLEGDLHGESYPCQLCDRHFSTRQGLERHSHIHAITAQQTQLFKCRYCSKSFGSQVGRRRHERRHESGPKKRPGSLAGTASSQFTGGSLHNSELQRKEPGPHADRPFILDENGESKELHPCKYCNKAFGTHTNMRRHQRRIHERHLLPKGVRRKGILLQEASAQQHPNESPSTSPPPVYVPSADTEDEADRDDYAVDISKNISENLSFYIDGKIVSTSPVSTCEVIEVDSRSAALFGLDTVFISPNQISQALKVEARTSAAKQVANIGQPTAKRRTSTPPLVPGLKVETETPTLSAADSSAFHREKTVYLSPKLKQLLQTQDIQKSTIAVITESHRVASPLSVTSLQGASGRFKRRTASPPSSPLLSPACKVESCKAEVVSSYPLKVPKLESHSTSPPGSLLDKEDGDSLSPPGNNLQGQSSNNGGNACNQQPLDLSYSFSRRSDNLNKALGDSALDLSLQRKSGVEPEVKGSPGPQPLIKKRKPNTSMLEKVLMNEYVGVSLPGDESPAALPSLGCFQPRSPNIASESAHPSPPSLTPVTMNPSSPGSSSVTSPTPPPPVLPTIPSPPTMSSSPLSQPSDSSTLRPLPVLSPKMSPRSVEYKLDSEEISLADEDKNEEQNHIPESLDSPKSQLDISEPSSPSEPALVNPPTTEDHFQNCNSLPNGKMSQNLDSVTEKSPILSSQPESSKVPPLESNDPPQPLVSQSLPLTRIKEEPQHSLNELSVMNHKPQDVIESPPRPADPANSSEKTSEVEGVDLAYCKTFVCNVCEQPFSAIKDLSGHITEHAVDWPFKCEFCVQLFGDAPALLAHRTTLHGVGRIFVCSVCSKEFAFLCNLQQHQKDLHPNEMCSHTTVESGKLRPQNYTDPSRAKEESSPSSVAPEANEEAAPHGDCNLAKEEPDVNGNHTEDPNEELYTTIKIMASEGSKSKGPDVRLGINQHYPSYKPPPFPYHSRSHAGSVASATNFTTHNIPQTFTTAIRCTKCGNSFDNMPELHQHILACANASDKKRYTPKKNPIPLKQIVKSPNGVVSPSVAAAGQSPFRRMGQPKRLNFNQETGKTKMSALSKKKNQLVQRAISQKNKVSTFSKKGSVKVEKEQPSNVCPHCSREFTYPASLSKHMAVSCPMKPAVKKGRKGLAEVKKEAVSAVDKNMSLRKKAPDYEIQQTETERRPLGKTRARSSGAAEPETSQPSKGKTAATVGRVKRPASMPAPTYSRKNPKKGHVLSLSSSLSLPDPPTDSAQQRPAMRMQRMGKVATPKRLAEAKQPSLQQPKREERFSLRTRDRVGGPVTRSLQMASSAPSADVKTEEPLIQVPKETQVHSFL